ncbi:MAG: hypothetical protein CSYNP_02812 [Syntrophus sp. SKADARSKE-3]|nr:hypothetical protein [Syntrophus sp. SKADARSKE-3]
MTWDIRFDGLLAEYVAAGGNGNELADMALMVFEDYGKTGLNFFNAGEGSFSSTSLSLWLIDSSQEKNARKWICNRLLKGDNAILNKIITALRHINMRAARKRAKQGMSNVSASSC